MESGICPIAAQAVTSRLLRAFVSWHMDAYYVEEVVQSTQNTYKTCIIISKLNTCSRIFQLSTYLEKIAKVELNHYFKKII